MCEGARAVAGCERAALLWLGCRRSWKRERRFHLPMALQPVVRGGADLHKALPVVFVAVVAERAGALVGAPINLAHPLAWLAALASDLRVCFHGKFHNGFPVCVRSVIHARERRAVGRTKAARDGFARRGTFFLANRGQVCSTCALLLKPSG